MKILIVDDNLTNLKLLHATLEAEGLTVFDAADGVEALLVLGLVQIDAVISDILMPRMDGYRLCRAIRLNEKLRGMPFILYTSTYTSPGDIKLAETVGADKYIIKPAPTAAILSAVHEAITAAGTRTMMAAEQPETAVVLEQYSRALVHKLEEKNDELQVALAARQRAHDRIVQLNNDLERRVRERTAELETANRELTRTLSEVKELRGILPICSYCKKIRDDRNYWQSVEVYLSQRTDAHFSHGYCPECHAQHVQPQLDAVNPDQGSP